VGALSRAVQHKVGVDESAVDTERGQVNSLVDAELLEEC
jgi:hypothetical protein